MIAVEARRACLGLRSGVVLASEGDMGVIGRDTRREALEEPACWEGRPGGVGLRWG